MSAPLLDLDFKIDRKSFRLIEQKQRDEEFDRLLKLRSEQLESITKSNICSIPDFFEACALRYSNNVFLQNAENSSLKNNYTYNEVNKKSNQIYFQAKKYLTNKQKVVGIMMENCADFTIIWLGLLKAGKIAALINTNQFGKDLGRGLKTAGLDVLIISIKYADVQNDFIKTTQNFHSIYLQQSIASTNNSKLIRPQCSNILEYILEENNFSINGLINKNDRALSINDIAFLIFTSGTTGLSKAVRISHQMFINCAFFKFLTQMLPSDTIYNCLPMYHSASLIVCHSLTMMSGAKMIVKKKFSASKFQGDIHKFSCTSMIYIGELQSYLLENAEKNNIHTKNTYKFNFIVGNGLRETVQKKIVAKFDIQHVVEFYGQSENPKGAIRSGMMVQIQGNCGACGYVPLKYLYKNQPLTPVLLEFDYENEKPIRQNNGGSFEFCKRVVNNQPGLLVYPLSKIYDGMIYTSKEESRRPILRNVFEKDDIYYSTGDLLKIDEEGFIHFVDRIGDTFRWKGENVSTNEICSVILLFPLINDAIVYGVRILGKDGKAGMAQISVKKEDFDKFNLKSLLNHLQNNLSIYSIPLFIRLNCNQSNSKTIDNKTSTFKAKKYKYQIEGFDPKKVGDDRIYFFSQKTKCYEILTNKIFSNQTLFDEALFNRSNM